MESSVATDPRQTDGGGCPVMHHDFSKQANLGGYWALANELREACPHFYNKYTADNGYWVFTRYDTVQDIYKTPEVFSSESITPWEPNPIYRFVPTQIDAPDHIKYRRILNPWFSPTAMESAAPTIREICRSYIEPLVSRGHCEFVNDFALLYPTAAFLNVLGVPTHFTQLFAGWVEDFFRGFGGDPAGLEKMSTALSEMRVGPRRLLTAVVRDISERRRIEEERREMNGRLVSASRAAGMAEVATSVLHNVGNVLNSVNVSVTLVGGQLQRSKIANLRRAITMMREKNGGLAEFLAADPKGKLLP